MRALSGSTPTAPAVILAATITRVSEPMPQTPDFLLKEYETARELTFHVDDLRARLTSYFVALSGGAIAGLSLLFGSAGSDTDSVVRPLVAASFVGVAFIGSLIVL